MPIARRRKLPRTGALSRLVRDRRGVSAVEFAMIAPVLFLMLFGMDETASAVMAQRRVSHATSEIGDLVSQYTTISAPQASDGLYSSSWVLAPFATSNTSGTLLYQERVTSIMMDGSSTPRVNWSCSAAGQPSLNALSAGATMTSLPKDSSGNYILLSTTAGDSVVMVESTYAYTSPLQYVITNGITFTNTFYYKPRESTQVVLQAGTSSTAPTSSTSPWTSSSSTVAYAYTSTTLSPSLSCNYQKN